MVRLDFKVNSKMLISVLQGKGLGEVDVLPYWKLEEVAFLQARHISPCSSGCANESYLAVCMTLVIFRNKVDYLAPLESVSLG